MIRTQVQLTKAQVAALKDAAAASGCSMAELIRQSVDFYLGRRIQDDRAVLRRRAQSVAGRFRSEEGDLSAQHDAYLAEDGP